MEPLTTVTAAVGLVAMRAIPRKLGALIDRAERRHGRVRSIHEGVKAVCREGFAELHDSEADAQASRQRLRDAAGRGIVGAGKGIVNAARGTLWLSRALHAFYFDTEAFIERQFEDRDRGDARHRRRRSP